ncbi:MAG TPA: group II intron maturase-specific domain-containing protein, partial [Solirubrobacteraceae bacterium]|nr:group II intron maturase-specific domain-containing protein [Solirubrobacteraceae bacterium]
TVMKLTIEPDIPLCFLLQSALPRASDRSRDENSSPWAVQAIVRPLAATVLATLGLRLHPEKTRIVHLTRGAEGFDFLGFHHHMRESWKRRGRWYLQKWPTPRAMASISGKIRERTDRRYAHLPLEWIVENLNPVLRGWGAYFRDGNSARKFAAIDAYVNQRLAMLASTTHR